MARLDSRAPGRLTLCLALLVGARALAGELGESADDPSAFSTVLHARDYDGRFASVEDLLARVPGVRVRRYGGLGAYSTASIRGAKAEQVLVLLDGVRVGSLERGAFDLSSVPLRQVERIEVLRGGGAARFGADALGGVVLITTRRPERAAPSADAALLGGSQATRGGDLSLSAGSEDLSALASYVRLRSDNDFDFEHRGATRSRANADFVEDGGLLRGELSLDARSRLEGALWLHQREGGQPGSVAVPCRSAHEQASHGVGRLALRRGVGRDGGLELAAHHRREASWLDDPGGACGLVDPLVTGGRTRSRLRESSSALELVARAPELDLGRAWLAARLSASLRHGGASSDDADTHRRTSAGFFAQADWALLDRRVRIVPALGFDAARTSDGRARVASAQPLRPVALRDESVWLPGIGAIVELAPGLRAKASWKRSFRRPSFAELFHPDQGWIRGNPRLRSERARNADLGLEWASGRIGALRDVSLELVAFRRDIEESIEWQLNVNNAVMPLNTGPARVRGLELGASVRLGRVDLGASYTRTDARIERAPCAAVFCNPVSLVFPHVPEHALFASAGVELGPARVYTELRHESELGFVVGQARTADAAVQIDAGISIRAAQLPGLGFLPREVTFSLDAINVGGEQRIDSLAQPLPGETLLIARLRAALP